MSKISWAAAGLFLLLGVLLIPFVGIEIDEAIFAMPIFRPIPTDLWIHVFGIPIPLMQMSYIGTLKTLLYWPIFKVAGVSAFTIRFPMVLAGAATILLLSSFLLGAVGWRVAVFAALLLASDPLFLITNTVDWGPVAVGHLLLVAACWAASRARFATCGFLLGLALWNKATFIWALAGLSAAVFVVYLPELRRIADRRTVIRAAIAFLLGAAPLLIYNALHPNATLSTNAKLSFDSLNDKVRQVEGALNGSSLQGYITNVEFSGRAKTVGSPVGRAAIWLESTFGSWRQSLFSYAVLLAVLALPFWWRTGGRRLGLFAIVFLVVAFLAMAVSKGGGGGAHHAVLLWPMFHVLVAVALCAVRVRWVSEGVVALLLIGNLLVVNQHFAQLERNGAKGPFNDAIYPLTRSQILRGRHVYVADWGIFDSLDVLTRGELDLRVASGPFMGGIPDEIQQREIRDLFADEVGVVVAHVAAEEMFAGINGRIDAAASAAGYRKEVLETVADSNSRPFFEVYRFVRR